MWAPAGWGGEMSGQVPNTACACAVGTFHLPARHLAHQKPAQQQIVKYLPEASCTVVSTGTISSLNLPAACAAAALACEEAARRSCRSRGTLNRSATFSAVRPAGRSQWPEEALGARARCQRLGPLCPASR